VKQAIAPAGLLLVALTLAVSATGCGSSNLGKISSPPIKDLSIPDLQELVSQCAKYPPNQATRGPYASAYCDQAITAYDVRTWSTPSSAPHSTALPAMK
jgi:hypothetical protein